MPANETIVGTSRGVESASHSAHKAIDRAAEAAHPAVDHLAANAHRAVNSAASGANHAAESLESSSTRLRNAQAQLTTGLQDFVRNRPVASLGIAVGVGLVLSSLLRRH